MFMMHIIMQDPSSLPGCPGRVWADVAQVEGCTAGLIQPPTGSTSEAMSKTQSLSHSPTHCDNCVCLNQYMWEWQILCPLSSSGRKVFDSWTRGITSSVICLNFGSVRMSDSNTLTPPFFFRDIKWSIQQIWSAYNNLQNIQLKKSVSHEMDPKSEWKINSPISPW